MTAAHEGRGVLVIGAFSDAGAYVHAASEAVRRVASPCCLTPFPVEGLDDVLGLGRSRLPRWIFAGGVAGASTGFGMQYFAMAVDYSFNVGGRPLNSWPAFLPITFELMVLFGALTAFLGVILYCGLPRLYRPEFESALVRRASRDRMVLVLHADREGAEALLQFLREAGADETEVLE